MRSAHVNVNYINILSKLKSNHPNRLIIGHLNINSLRHKFDFLRHEINGKIDILMISETKLDSSFPIAQFSIEGFSTPYRLDRNKFGGGIILYVREDIPSQRVKKQDSNEDVENFFVEINLRGKNGRFLALIILIQRK